MSVRACEVIGCRNAAAWALTQRGDPKHERLLCRLHWDYLSARVPDRSAWYSLVDEDLDTPDCAVVRMQLEAGEHVAGARV